MHVPHDTTSGQEGEDERRGRRLHERFLSRARSGREDLAKLAEATRDDVTPAIESLRFATETAETARAPHLAMHDAAAMWTLLGRHVGAYTKSATIALDYVATIFEAFAEEGVEVSPETRASLSSVFVEGYVRRREELARADAEDAQLSSLVPRRIMPGVELLILGGPYEPEALERSLTAWVRGVFHRDAKVAILDLLGLRGFESAAQPLREAMALLFSLGVETVMVLEDQREEPFEGATRVSTLEEAVARSLSGRSLSELALGRARRLFFKS